MKVQEMAYLNKKWMKEGCSKKQLLWSNLLCVLYFFKPQAIIAQPVWQLRNEDFIVKQLMKPLKPLPDSIKTYQITSEMTLFPFITGLDERIIKDIFRLEFYEKRLSDADLMLSVHIKGFTTTNELQSRTVPVVQNQPTSNSVTKSIGDSPTTKASTRKSAPKSNVEPPSKDSTETYYWYEERITPQVTITLKDKSGKWLFSKEESEAAIYVSEARKSQKTAKMAFDSEKRTAVYAKKIRESYFNTVKAGANRVRDSYDYQSEVISLYYPKEKDSLFLKNIKSAQESLIQMGTTTSQSELMAQLKPNIDFFEKEIYNNINGSRKAKRRYYASALNLANIYRCLEDFDKALFYIRLLINDNYSQCRPHTGHLVAMKARFEAYNYYRKMGVDLYETMQKDTQRVDSICLEALKKNIKSKGYIILNKNNLRINGDILDIIKNFKNRTVKLKYKKTLNDPPMDSEYSLADVKEIHIKEGDFAIVPYKNAFGNKIYLTKILFQNSQIILSRRIQGMNLINNQNTIGLLVPNFENVPLEFVKKSNESKFRNLDGVFLTSFDGNLSHYLKDCPIVSRQARYGYYTEQQLLQTIRDYDSICGSKQNQNLVDTMIKTKKIKYKNGASVHLGLSIGVNNFNGAIGIHSSVRLKEQLLVRFGVGLGGAWGTKFAIGIKYDFLRDMRYRKGWSLALGYSHNTRPKREILDIPTTQLLAVDAIHFSIIRNSLRGKKKAIYYEIGYSIPLQKKSWLALTQSQEEFIRFERPGGLIIGLGLNFALK